MVMFIRGTSPAQTNVFSSVRPLLAKFFSLLNKLNKSEATGLDKISARLTRECADLICIPICDTFNQSISLGIFSDHWKCARVTPLFKQGDRDDLNNYRPIYVISVVANVFERIVYDQLYAYLEEHDISVNINRAFVLFNQLRRLFFRPRILRHIIFTVAKLILSYS